MQRFPKKIICCVLFLLSAVFLRPAAAQTASAVFHVDAAELAAEPIGNKLSNVNLWMFQSLSLPNERDRADGADLTPFVEYLQFMQATGSSPDRDLFKDPANAEILDDYDFEPLLNACAKTLALGARPHIKFSVPSKYSSTCQMGDFKTNVFPPDDYEVYGAFVRALARALVERFGRDEVLSWRFGVLTEFENPGWFKAESGTPEDSREAYFKLYDYTVDALAAEIGPEVCVGAHAMACSEGLWDERDLLDHCAAGRNYKTGGVGTRIRFMAVSFYDKKPGVPAKDPLPVVVGRLRARAEEVGLTDLFYGADEGRILYGVHSGAAADDLLQRMVGRTYQAAFDARLLKQAVDADIDYISSWSYSSSGAYHGIPTVSYFVARLFSEFRGAYAARVERETESAPEGVELDAVAGYEPDARTLRLMVYHFKDDYDYAGSARASLKISVPDFAGKKLRVISWTVDDGVNFFPEWEKDREKFGIGDDDFRWSPDDPGIDSPLTLADPDARALYEKELRPRYAQIARLTPKEEELPPSPDGMLLLEAELGPHAVVFYEIAEAE
ncbi:MAG: hypothetical protein IK105_09935 [Thermoguttaceae bacterium]|nr:hypothetical protein [Thermoguttaceae bacterium]